MHETRISASPAKKCVAWIAVVLGLSGCRGVESLQPFGERPHAIVVEEWEGPWLDSENGVLLLTVTDPTEGLLLMTGIERKQGQPLLKSDRVYLRESGGWLFASLLEEKTDAADPDRYFWVRIRNDGDILMVWFPHADKFEQLVREGALPGRVESGGVVLEELDSAQYALITSEERGTLFEWDDPIVFRRIAGR